MFYTFLSVPGPVRNLSFEVIPKSEGSVRISWVAPAVTNGDIESYEVTYGVLGGADLDMKLTKSNLSVVLTNLSESIQVSIENSLTQLVKCLCYSHSWSDSI